ncbi:MAG: type II toxin-antitoxin system VapC family toxin [Candidatus Electrothrix sp. AX5]|nr:type II toxin-antitoxin system VapC family toxin [Candidatus Electrothrix sp. AX5]
MRAYIDADVLIWHLRGQKQAQDFLIKLRDQDAYELYTGALQRAEVIFFMRPDEEEATELFLSQFKTEPVDQEIIDAAGILYRKWQPSHGIDVNDAILAATSIRTGGRIFTLNIKHYPMPEVNVQKAWE